MIRDIWQVVPGPIEPFDAAVLVTFAIALLFILGQVVVNWIKCKRDPDWQSEGNRPRW